MAGERYDLTSEQLDNLTVGHARKLLDGLREAVNSAGGSDDLMDLVEPLLRMVEQSLLGRPAVDLETLAAKVMIAFVPFDDNDLNSLAVQRDCDRILSMQT